MAERKTFRNTYSRNIGCKGDPRMNLAVSIRLANPKMSLYDALLAGGFTFPTPIKRQNKKEAKIYDSDGVSLNQRRNQLSKRLWQAKKKQAIPQDTSHHKDQVMLGRSTMPISTKDEAVGLWSVGGIEADIFPLHKLPSDRQMQQQSYTTISRPIVLMGGDFSALGLRNDIDVANEYVQELLDCIF